MENVAPTAMSSGSLSQALKALGDSDSTLETLIDVLRAYERTAEPGTGVNIREEVTGPIVDAAIGHGRPMTKSLRNGLKFSFNYTSKILRDFVMSDDPVPDHVWEPQTTKTILALTKDAETVVIGGAYIGDHAILVADQIKPSGVVHCFELSSDNAALLQLNAEQNDLTNLEINRVGLWSSADVRLSLWGEDSHAAPAVATGSAEDSFPATSIDSYTQKNGVSRIDLIMLDIEGGELEALRGAQAQLEKESESAPNLIFEVHGHYVDWSKGLGQTDIGRYLQSFGYTLFAIRDYHSNVAMTDRPVELVDVEDVYLGGPAHGFNMLATKRPETLSSDVFRICRGVSPKLMFHRDPKLHAPLA